LSLLIAVSLLAATETLLIDAGLADYDGKKVTLTGGVVVEHELGQIAASRAVMTPEPGSRRQGFSSLALEEGVRLSLSDGGTLCCSRAELDMERLTGRLSSDDKEQWVVFSDLNRLKGGKAVPLILKSGSMALKLQKRGEDEEERYFVESMVGEGAVTVNYAHDYLVTADSWKYERRSGGKEKGTGLITLESPLPGRLCRLCSVSEETMQAKRVLIDTGSGLLAMQGPATLERAGGRLTASGGVIIDYKKGCATLLEGIHYDDRRGELFADQAIIDYREENGHLVPVKLLLTGSVRAVNHCRQAGSEEEQYALADRVELDLGSGQARLSAVKPNRVLFFDKFYKMQVSASALTLSRELETKKERIKGEGDVRFHFRQQELDEIKKRFKFDE